MEPTDILLAASSLLGTLVGGLLVWWTQTSQWKRSRRADSDDQEAAAIHKLLTKAVEVDMHAHHLVLAAQVRGSLSGSIASLVGEHALFDTQASVSAMTTEVAALQDAASFIWLTSEPRTVELASDVADAAADIIAAHSKRNGYPGLLSWLVELLRGPRLGDPRAIAEARALLAERRELLVAHPPAIRAPGASHGRRHHG